MGWVLLLPAEARSVAVNLTGAGMVSSAVLRLFILLVRPGLVTVWMCASCHCPKWWRKLSVQETAKTKDVLDKQYRNMTHTGKERN